MREMFRSNMTTFVPVKLTWQRLLPSLCVALVLLLTPFATMQRDIWTDEAFTASYTTYPTISVLLDDVRKNEETPPIPFLLIWVWSRMAGQSEVALRAFSMLWGVLAVLLFACFVRRWFAPTAAWIAAIIMALAPLMASYLVEARGYTLTLLLGVACITAFERLYRQPQRLADYIPYALAAAALFLTSYFGVVVLLAHNLIWLGLLLRERALWLRRFLCWCGVQVFVGATVLPWLPSLLYQMQVAPAVTSFWGHGLWDYYLLAFSLLLHAPPGSAWLWLWSLLVMISWGLIILALLRARRQDDGLVVRTFWVPALVLIVMVLWMQVVAPRYLIIVLPGGAMAVAQGARELRRLWPRVGAALIAVLLVGMLVYRLPAMLRPESLKPWTALTAEMEPQADPARDVVLFHPPWDQRIFEYYYRGPRLRLFGAHDYDTFYYEQGYDLRKTWKSDEAIAVTRGSKRVWVFYDQMFHTVPRLNLPYIEVGHWRSDRLELFLYEIPAS
jgi:4-amino-4-deoxy-L-arabinose transferase-like glycosyltransferase